MHNNTNNNIKICFIKSIIVKTFFLLIKACTLRSILAYSLIPSDSSNKNVTPIMRAWACHGRTQRDMVDKLASANIITHKVIRDCMNQVDRLNYIAHTNPNTAYDDTPQTIGYGATISAPHMHAHVLEELLPIFEKFKNTNKIHILDVGCGSGYLVSCFGRLVSSKDNALGLLESGSYKVFGIEYVPELVEMSKRNIKKADNDLLESGTVQVSLGNGWKGLPAHAPFHAIHVGAAADTFPKALMMQLAVGGRMVIPVGPDGGYQSLYRVDRIADTSSNNKFNENDYIIQQLLGVRYVPLVRGEYTSN